MYIFPYWRVIADVLERLVQWNLQKNQVPKSIPLKIDSMKDSTVKQECCEERDE
jgi:hypothetical protein